MPKRKQDSCNFLGIVKLGLPDVLVDLCVSYSSFLYCSTCKALYPQKLACLSCPDFESIETQTRGFMKDSTAILWKGFQGYSMQFDDDLDQEVWNYVFENLPDTHSFFGASWIGCNELPHRLKVKVQTRKRTRSSREWWSASFKPIE